jgi:putative transposase
MRELDFSEANLFNRLCGVNSIWKLLQGEVKRYVKVRLERALTVEREARVGCGRYQRHEARQDYRNGSYSRDLLTSYGWIDGVKVPRLRYGPVVSEVFGRYERRQGVVDRVLLESFLLGHSTRKTRRLFGTVFGESVSAPTVSRVVAHLDDDVRAFHTRPLSGGCRYLYLDGLWVTLRKPVKVRKVILVALGVWADGSRELLSFQLAPSESESCWWGFLSDLKFRGLRSPQLVITDGAAGLIKAVQALYPRADHQRCGVHKAFEAAGRVEDSRRCRSFRLAAVSVFEAQTVGELRARLKAFTDRWSPREPKAVQAFVRGLDGCLTYLKYPPPLHKKLYNTNLIERYIEEIRRRTIPMRSFNNARSAERIIYGLIAYVLNQNPMEMPTDQFTQDA